MRYNNFILIYANICNSKLLQHYVIEIIVKESANMVYFFPEGKIIL